MGAGRLPGFFHHRWTAPILAELHRTNGAKFITLVGRLSIPRETLIRTLRVLIRSGWVRRNPGHGHPLRPEYLPTARGRTLGGACERLMFELRRRDLEGVKRSELTFGDERFEQNVGITEEDGFDLVEIVGADADRQVLAPIVPDALVSDHAPGDHLLDAVGT